MTYKEKFEQHIGKEIRIEGDGCGSIFIGDRKLLQDCCGVNFGQEVDCLQTTCKNCWNRLYDGSKIKIDCDKLFMEDFENADGN